MKSKIIKKMLAFGFREYTPSSVEQSDRAWQKTFNEEKTLSISVRFWEHSKYPYGHDSFDIMIYNGTNEDLTEQINIYAFNDDDFDKAYKRALKYIKNYEK